MYIRLPGSECHIDSVAIATSVQHGSIRGGPLAGPLLGKPKEKGKGRRREGPLSTTE